MLGLPLLAMAQQVKTTYVDSLIAGVLSTLRGLLILLISLAVVWFIWNVIKYSMSKEEDGKDKAKTQMIHGIIAIAVIVSVWGIVALLQNAFGIQQGQGAGDYYNMIPGGSPSIPSSNLGTGGSGPLNSQNNESAF